MVEGRKHVIGIIAGIHVAPSENDWAPFRFRPSPRTNQWLRRLFSGHSALSDSA